MMVSDLSGKPPSRRQPGGFTLVELAIVLVIVGLLAGGMMLSLTTQQDTANLKETRRRLDLAQEALLGFAAANGRLPCPASEAAASGAEAPNNGSGTCTTALNGFLPAATLGLAPTDAQGYFVDAWSHRIRYAVYPNGVVGSPTILNRFTTPDGIRTTKIESIAATTPLLLVCGSGATVTATDCGSETVLTNQAAAVIFSTGKNGGAAATGDEAKNTDGDVVFVSRTATDFDDVVTWLSPNILFNRLITAGRLP